MNTQRWKPGDVAMVTYDGDRTSPAIYSVGTGAGNPVWETGTGYLMAHRIESVRPLVVLDPENREHAIRMTEAFYAAGYDIPKGTDPHQYDQMRAALRSLVTPPRPAEPTGLGAVVVDTDERAWVRVPLATNDRRWFCRDTGEWAAYTNVTADRVLSEGI